MEMAKKREKCTTGCELLDAALEGGILCGSITELVGESTAGKTQLALQLLITAQFPVALGGLNGAAFYIPTEAYFPSRRLRQLASSFQASKNLNFDPNKNVFVEPAESVQDLFKLLDRLEKLLNNQQQVQERRVRLMVIDSVAALFRTEFENNRNEMVVRARVLFQLAGRLLKLAHKHNVAVVVTNQVMDVIDGSGGVQIGSLSELVSSGRKVAPALGLSWSHCINIRIFLSRAEQVAAVAAEGQCKRQRLDGGGEQQVVSGAERVTKRILHLVFAPHLPYKSCGFYVDESGVHGEFPG